MMENYAPNQNQLKTSGLAIAALVLGILGFFTFALTALPGLILGIIAYVQIENRKDSLTGKGMAIGGVVTSAIALVMIPFLILPAILFPVFAKAREKARQSTCQSNVKEICIAFNMYAQDYDECYPVQRDWRVSNWSDDRTAVEHHNWAYAVMPYIKGNKIFCCPTAGDSPKQISYVYNGRLANGLSENEITKPAETILVTDGGQDSKVEIEKSKHPYVGGLLEGSSRTDHISPSTGTATKAAATAEMNGGELTGIGLNPDEQGMAHGIFALHSGGMMVGYSDGHVYWQKWEWLKSMVANGTSVVPNNPYLPHQR
jgi:prepilin-type processing-associated H-X9-DG protein